MCIVFRSVLTTILLTVLCVSPAVGQWVEPPGTGWIDLGIAHQDTRKKFNRRGNVVPFDTKEARSIVTTARITGALGLYRGVDVWADVAFHRIAFNDAQANRLNTGLADPRVYVRVGPSLFGIDDLPLAVALRGGLKFPVGDFSVDANAISLSQGQRDWDLLLEVGKSLHPWPVYVMGWVGYRWREVNHAIQEKPGDERLFYAAAGGSVHRFRWKLAVDGLFGKPPVRTDFDLVLPNDERELVQIIPTVGWKLGPGAIEAGLRVPVHGRKFPAGPVFTLGYFLSWDDPIWK
ncbi:MAG: hypothetical protein ABEL51_13490 [Salinibacter sp.]